MLAGAWGRGARADSCAPPPDPGCGKRKEPDIYWMLVGEVYCRRGGPRVGRGACVAPCRGGFVTRSGVWEERGGNSVTISWLWRCAAAMVSPVLMSRERGEGEGRAGEQMRDVQNEWGRLVTGTYNEWGASDFSAAHRMPVVYQY
jgi:hypothetical protein